MEKRNVPNGSNNISVSTELEKVMDRYGVEQKAIRYSENIVLRDGHNNLLKI